jgi:hypothetical protein
MKDVAPPTTRLLYNRFLKSLYEIYANFSAAIRTVIRADSALRDRVARITRRSIDSAGGRPSPRCAATASNTMD